MRNRIAAQSVITSALTPVLWRPMKEFTLVRNHSDAQSVAKHSEPLVILRNMKERTQMPEWRKEPWWKNPKFGETHSLVWGTIYFTYILNLDKYTMIIDYGIIKTVLIAGITTYNSQTIFYSKFMMLFGHKVLLGKWTKWSIGSLVELALLQSGYWPRKFYMILFANKSIAT